MEAANTIYADCHVPVYIMNNVKYKNIYIKKIQYKNSNTQTFTNMHISCSVPTRSKDFIRTVCHGGGLSCCARS